MNSDPIEDEARKRIGSIQNHFRESALRVTRFLSDAERGFDLVRTEQTSIVERLEAAKAGEPLPPPSGADLVSIELKIEEVEMLERVMKEATAATAHYPGMLAEMALIYLIANFEAFLSDLLYVVFTSRPEILKSSKQLTVADVVDADSREALIDDLAQREVSTWTYLSFRDQTARLSEVLGISFEAMEDPLGVATEAHARRNLLVHRGGVIDERYFEAVRDASHPPGSRIDSDPEYVEGVASALLELADGLANDIVERCLPRN